MTVLTQRGSFPGVVPSGKQRLVLPEGTTFTEKGHLFRLACEHKLMIRDYLRHSNLNVTNKYLEATSNSKRLAQGKLVDAVLPGGVLTASKSNLIH